MRLRLRRNKASSSSTLRLEVGGGGELDEGSGVGRLAAGGWARRGFGLGRVDMIAVTVRLQCRGKLAKFAKVIQVSRDSISGVQRLRSCVYTVLTSDLLLQRRAIAC